MKKLKQRSILLLTAINTLLLTSCAAHPSNNQAGPVEETVLPTLSELSIEPVSTLTPSPAPTETPEPTATSEPSPTPMPEIDPAEFDYSMLDIMQWEGELKVSNIEELKPGYIVQVRQGYKGILYQTELFADYATERFADMYTGITLLEIPEGISFELLEKKIISAEDGKSITIAVVRNTTVPTTSGGVLSIVLSAETSEGEQITFAEKVENQTSTISTFIDFGGDTHPRDIQGATFLVREILAYQEEHGPFLAGQEYSFREMLAERFPEEFRNVLWLPDGTNFSLDKALTNLSRILIHENNLAKRISPVPEWPSSAIGIGAEWKDRYIYGTTIKNNGKEENDLILQFNEDAYIDADIYLKDLYLILNFQITQDAPNWEKKIEDANLAYLEAIRWDKGRIPVDLSKTLSGEADGYRKYLLGYSYTEEEIEKINRIIDCIYKPTRLGL